MTDESNTPEPEKTETEPEVATEAAAEAAAETEAEAEAETEAESQERADSKREAEAEAAAEREHEKRGGGGGDRTIPLRKLVELAAKYPEVGPPLAELAFAIGETEVGEQLVRLGTDRETPHVEYWFVAANAARRERRYEDVVSSIIDAVRIASSRDDALAAGEEERLLHLVRLGFATLMFDLKQLTPEAPFVQAMAQGLPALEPRMGQMPFFRTLLAQTLWFSDKEASEREWDRADEMGDDESTWNARGTWYHEAEQDLDKSERAYRKGLEKAPQSALLMHNLAQILVEKAKRPGTSPADAHRLLNQAVDKLRTALRQDAPRLRRHIHATRDRLEDFRRTLPMPARKPGDPRPQQRYGGGGGGGGYGGGGGGYGGGGNRPQGQGRPQQQQGQGRPPGNRPPQDRDRRPQQQQHQPARKAPPSPEQKFLAEGKMSLGEMILAKLREKDAK